MRKALIIILAVIILAILGWYFFLRGSNSPIAQTLNNVLPFGTPGEGSATTTPSKSPASFGTTTPSGTSAPTSRLFKISDAAVAGAVSITSGSSTIVRYVERDNGHIYDVEPATLQKTEIVNFTIPKVYEAIFTSDGSKVAFRTLPNDGDSIQTLIYTLIPPAGTSTADLYTTKAVFLPSNISELAVGSTTLAYTTKGSPSVTESALDGSKPAIVFTSPFNEWRLSLGGGLLLMTAKASVSVPGYAYIVDSKGGLSKLFGPDNGLTTMPNSTMTRTLFSSSDNGDALFAKNISTGAVTPVTPATLAEKCAWSIRAKSTIYCGVPSEGLGDGEPDLWYQGMAHFTDRIWRSNTDTEAAELLSDPKQEFNISIDAEHLFLSPNEDYLFFTNRNDLSLWALKL